MCFSLHFAFPTDFTGLTRLSESEEERRLIADHCRPHITLSSAIVRKGLDLGNYEGKNNNVWNSPAEYIPSGQCEGSGAEEFKGLKI